VILLVLSATALFWPHEYIDIVGLTLFAVVILLQKFHTPTGLRSPL
jgi:hypothetical protein